MASSSTVRAKPRLLMAPFARPAQTRYRRMTQPEVRAARISSRAGLARRPWLARLRRALEQDLFVLHFQPIVSLLDGRVTHHEALVRLADDAGGRLVGPASFLPAAERYGLIGAIDRMVLDKVTALLGDERGKSTVAVNLATALALQGLRVAACLRQGRNSVPISVAMTDDISLAARRR